MSLDLKSILSDVAKKKSFENPQINTFPDPGNLGLVGKLTTMEITDDTPISRNPNRRRLSVVLKQPTGDVNMHASLSMDRFFQLEILYYTKIAPTLRDLQLEYDVNCLKFIECFYTNDTHLKEIIVLENLRDKGYDILNHSGSIKATHIMMAFEELAKMHGLCFALKKLKPDVYEELMEPLYKNTFCEVHNLVGIDAFLEKMTDRFRTRFEGTKYEVPFCNFADRIADEFNKANTIDEYAIMCHGDAWCNNIMFTHDVSGNPTSGVYIDFQLNRIQSPATDLSYLFYGCADIDLLPRLKEFLKHYHTTLAKCLAMFRLDVEEIYPWDKFMDHWKDYGKQGFITSFIVRVIMLSSPDEAPSLDDSMNKDVPIIVAKFYFKMKREDEYNHAIESIVKHFIDEGYIGE